MKKHMLTLLLLSCCCLIGIKAQAQKKFTFGYDGNGNRTAIGYINSCRIKQTDSIVEQPIQLVTQPKAYPNPAREYVTISFPETMSIENATISLYNLQGSLVFKEEGISTQHTRMGVCNFPSGMYILRVDYGADTPFVTKIELIR